MPLYISLRAQADSLEDLSFLRELFLTLGHNQYLAVLDPKLVELQLQAREQQYRQQFPKALFQLILHDEVPVGRLVEDRSQTAWHLIDIAILPEFRNLGIGGRIVESLVAEAAAQGRDIHASVAAENLAAHRFYERLGFTVINRESLYWSLRYCPVQDGGTHSA